jgi:uncharacterized RDD family membrane protein YckC
MADDVEVIRYRAAGFWRRLAAGMVDGILMVPVAGLFGIALASLLGGRVPHMREIGVDYIVELLLGRDPLSLIGAALALVLIGLYFVLLHATRGQTIGKLLCGVRVITKAGERPSVLRALGRTGGCVLSWVLFSLGFIWIAFDREKRGLHDFLAGTYVVLVR